MEELNSVRAMGFSSHLLWDRNRMRLMYEGTGNTILGLLALVPIVCGWLLETAFYTVSSSAALLLATAGFSLSLALSPRKAIASIGAYQ